MKILIRNVDIITADDAKEFIVNGNIGIEDGYIKFTNATEQELNEFGARRVINGRNKLAMPGLVNAHTHCAMTIFRNSADDLALEEWLFKRIFPAEARLSEEDVYWGSMLGIAEMIKSGTTAFADMYLYMDGVAQAVCETGVRANLSRSPLKFVSGDTLEIIDETSYCYDYYKNWHGKGEGRIKVYIEVHSAYLYDENSLSEAAELARQLKTGIHTHILETGRELEESIARYGMDSVCICEKCGIFDVPVIAAHCVHLSDEDIEILKNKNVHVTHNPTSNLKLGSGVARIPEMLGRGLNISLGTDGAASNNNLNMFEEMHIAALIHKGVNRNAELMGAGQVIRMATVNGAKAIGFGDETGCIKCGMKADLILIDTDSPHFCPVNDPVSSVVYTAQGSDVDTVIVDGNILMEGKELKTIDEKMVMEKVRKISQRYY